MTAALRTQPAALRTEPPALRTEPPALRTENLGKHFGGVRAIEGVSLAVEHGARHAIIGPNGAGKTTLINLVTGALAPDQGEVFIGPERVTALRADRRVKRGLARTFQVNNLFAELTVLESMLLAVCEQRGVAVNPWRPLAGSSAELTAARQVLHQVGLQAAEDEITHALAYGQKRMLEIGLALACRPRILLLDEPSAGVPRRDSQALFQGLAGLPGDVTVLFIEHDMDLVFRFASRITVLVAGQILAEGSPTEIARDPRVKQVYLGGAS